MIEPLSARTVMEHARYVTRAIRDSDVTRLKLAEIITSNEVHVTWLELTVADLRAQIEKLKAELAGRQK